jgi:DNA-binding NtrC family response regulator
MKPRIAVLDDEPNMVDVLSMMLGREGYEVAPFTDPAGLLESLLEGSFDLLVTDLRMPGCDGLEVLKRVRETDPAIVVILMTAHATVSTAITAMREGAFDYIQKPFDNDELKALVKRALDLTRLDRENRYLRAEVRSRYALERIVAESGAMRAALDLARRAARSPSTVLIAGESGTGKELVARSVHYHSDRVGGPFVAVNCKALAAGVLESELFGHEKGAFTGAASTRKGLFEEAAYGTLFLDEIGDIDLEFQAKLLRVLQEKQVRRVGGSSQIATDVRVVAATNRDLRADVREGKFREDLYFRLAVIPILLPPLRARPEDVIPLARHFLARWTEEMERPGLVWSADVEAYLTRHRWPGNVRELENAIERGVVLARGDTIEIADLLIDEDAAVGDPAPDDGTRPAAGGGLREFLDAAAAERIRGALTEAAGVRTEAARALGIDRATLYRLMRKYGVDDSNEA